MNFQTPSKKIQNHLPYQPKTQSQKREEQTHQKMATNVEDDKETASKPNQYVCSKDRKIRKLCFSSIQVNRGRILDWFLEVFSIYHLGWQSYWICVQLLDSLIGDYNYVDIKNIHIVGVVCIFTSSKYSNVQPLGLSQIISQICHKRFSKLQILKQEQNILGLIFQDSSIERYTIYHYLTEEFQHYDHHLICEGLQWMALAWTNLQAVLQKFGVQTYKQLARKIMCYISRGLQPEFLLSILHENEKKWGTTLCAWRRYSHKIHL